MCNCGRRLSCCNTRSRQPYTPQLWQSTPLPTMMPTMMPTVHHAGMASISFGTHALHLSKRLAQCVVRIMTHDQRHDPDNHDEVHRFGKLMQAKRRSQSHTCPLICDNGLRFEVWPLTDTCATPWKAGPCTHVSGHCFSVWTCVCGRVRLNKGLVGCGMVGSCTADSFLHVFVVI